MGCTQVLTPLVHWPGRRNSRSTPSFASNAFENTSSNELARQIETLGLSTNSFIQRLVPLMLEAYRLLGKANLYNDRIYTQGKLAPDSCLYAKKEKHRKTDTEAPLELPDGSVLTLAKCYHTSHHPSEFGKNGDTLLLRTYYHFQQETQLPDHAKRTLTFAEDLWDGQLSSRSIALSESLSGQKVGISLRVHPNLKKGLTGSRGFPDTLTININLGNGPQKAKNKAHLCTEIPIPAELLETLQQAAKTKALDIKG